VGEELEVAAGNLSWLSCHWLLMAIVDCMQDGFCPAARAADDQLRHASGSRHAAASCATVAWVSSGWRTTRLWRGKQGVPFTLPLREGSSGGPYGTAAEWHVPCRPMSPVGVAIRVEVSIPRVELASLVAS
jgi:hypothetical protein